MRHLALPLCLSAASLLAGCDALGLESATQLAERKQAEAHAIGSACRHAIRSIEDCFKFNPRAGKAAVFAGWKEMDQYMRDNQVVGMPSEDSIGSPEAAGAHGADKATADTQASGKSPAGRSTQEGRTHRS